MRRHEALQVGHRRRTARDRGSGRRRPPSRCSPLPCEPNSGLSTSSRPAAASRITRRCACAADSHAPRSAASGCRRGAAASGHRLVDAALDRARVVVDRHAELAQRVQHAEAQGHLLEAAAGDAAHDHRIGQPAAEAGDHQAVPAQRRCRCGSRPGRRSGRSQPRARSAACSWRVCQPVSSVMIATDRGDASQAVARHRSCALSLHRHCVASQQARGPVLPACQVVPLVEVADPHLGRREQRRVDLVEVVLVVAEDLGERPAVVARIDRRQAPGQVARGVVARRAPAGAPGRRRGWRRWCGPSPRRRRRPAAAAARWPRP